MADTADLKSADVKSRESSNLSVPTKSEIREMRMAFLKVLLGAD